MVCISQDNIKNTRLKLSGKKPPYVPAVVESRLCLVRIYGYKQFVHMHICHYTVYIAIPFYAITLSTGPGVLLKKWNSPNENTANESQVFSQSWTHKGPPATPTDSTADQNLQFCQGPPLYSRSRIFFSCPLHFQTPTHLSISSPVAIVHSKFGQSNLQIWRLESMCSSPLDWMDGFLLCSFLPSPRHGQKGRIGRRHGDRTGSTEADVLT